MQKVQGHWVCKNGGIKIISVNKTLPIFLLLVISCSTSNDELFQQTSCVFEDMSILKEMNYSKNKVTYKSRLNSDSTVILFSYSIRNSGDLVIKSVKRSENIFFYFKGFSTNIAPFEKVKKGRYNITLERVSTDELLEMNECSEEN